MNTKIISIFLLTISLQAQSMHAMQGGASSAESSQQPAAMEVSQANDHNGAMEVEADTNKRESSSLEKADQQDGGQTKRLKLQETDDFWDSFESKNPQTRLQLAIADKDFERVLKIIQTDPSLISCYIADDTEILKKCCSGSSTICVCRMPIITSAKYPLLIYLIKKNYNDLLRKVLAITGVKKNMFVADALYSNDRAIIEYVWNNFRKLFEAYFTPTLFEYAIRYWHRNTILFLLDSGLEIPLKINIDGFVSTPLHHAVGKNDKELITLLYKRFPQLLKEKDDRGEIPLQKALYERDSEDADYFFNLISISDLEERDGFGNTVLHGAASMPDLRMFKYLWEKLPQFWHAYNNAGRSPIHLLAVNARNHNYYSSLIWLLHNDKTGQIIQPDAAGQTIFDYLPIHVLLDKAAQCEPRDLAKYKYLIDCLAQFGAPITKETIAAARRLEAKYPSLTAVFALLADGEEYHSKTRNKIVGRNLKTLNGNGPLIPDVLKVVAEYLGSPEGLWAIPPLPSPFPARLGQAAMEIEMPLVAYSSRSASPITPQLQPLKDAIDNENEEAIRQLLKKNPLLINCGELSIDNTNQKLTPLGYAVAKNKVIACRILVQLGADYNQFEINNARSTTQNSILHFAVHCEHEATITHIINTWPQLVNKPNRNQQAPLQYALTLKKYKSAVLLLKAPDIDTSWLSDEDILPIEDADTIKILLTQRPDARLPLLHAIRYGYLAGTKALIELGDNDLGVDDTILWYAIKGAIERSSSDIIQLLCERFPHLSDLFSSKSAFAIALLLVSDSDGFIELRSWAKIADFIISNCRFSYENACNELDNRCLVNAGVFRAGQVLLNILNTIKTSIIQHEVKTENLDILYNLLQKLFTNGYGHSQAVTEAIGPVLQAAKEIDQVWYDRFPNDLDYNPFAAAICQRMREYEIQKLNDLKKSKAQARAAAANLAAWQQAQASTGQLPQPDTQPSVSNSLWLGLAAAAMVTTGSKFLPSR